MKSANVCRRFCDVGSEQFRMPKEGLPCLLGNIPNLANSIKTKPFKHNPKTKEATHNMIRNGGRHQICFMNPWKYDEVKR